MENVKTTILSGFVMLTMLIGMTGYEWLKQLIFPQLTLWQSHAMTIFLSSALTSAACYILLRINLKLHRKVGSEIAEQKGTEEALRESERRYKELADLLPQPVFEMDFDGNLSFVNRSAFELFGYSEEDLQKGLNAFDMVIPEERDLAVENIKKRLSGEVYGWTEYTALRKGGVTFPAMMRSTLVTCPISSVYFFGNLT